MLFIDYSSAFNTIVPTKLLTKLRNMRLNTSLCNCILDFLTGYPHVVRVGNNVTPLKKGRNNHKSDTVLYSQ